MPPPRTAGVLHLTPSGAHFGAWAPSARPANAVDNVPAATVHGVTRANAAWALPTAIECEALAGVGAAHEVRVVAASRRQRH